jgi:hypothetical protein
MEAGKGTCATCAGYVRLLGGCDYFPTDTEVRRLLVERLHRLAKNHDHAKAMIDRWLDTQTVAPKIADLVALAKSVHREKAELPAGCEKCLGYGMISCTREIDGRSYGYVRCCECARGQYYERVWDEAKRRST